jgi:hypothetical protein
LGITAEYHGERWKNKWFYALIGRRNARHYKNRREWGPLFGQDDVEDD